MRSPATFARSYYYLEDIVRFKGVLLGKLTRICEGLRGSLFWRLGRFYDSIHMVNKGACCGEVEGDKVSRS